MKVFPIVKDETKIVQMMYNILGAATHYVEHSSLKSLVVGVSGGIDSALVTVLAREVCKRLNNKVKLIGRSLPINSSPEEISRAETVGSLFCDDFKTFDLSNSYDGLKEHMEHPATSDGIMGYKIRSGNIKARTRMIQLFHIAHAEKGMVLSTDNFTELLLGFWTLHGDVGNYGMIQNVWKTEVYMMSDLLHVVTDINHQEKEAISACIQAAPTDGLGITNTDLDQFGDEVKSYADADILLYEVLSGNLDVDPIPKVVKMYKTTHFKRNDPTNIPRAIIDL